MDEALYFSIRDRGGRHFMGKATLPDVEFDDSTLRDRRGWVVDGYLYSVTDEDGAETGKQHRRIALRPDGSEITVVTGEVVSADLVETCRSPPVIAGLFCYGTLMRGGERFPILNEGGLDRIVPAEAPGLLFDLGPYPGMVLAAKSGARVKGEFACPHDIETRLGALDAAEDFFGFGHGDNLYRRTLIDVRLDDGPVECAWVYVMDRAPDGHPRIESGDWRAHRGR